jgi:hypothetical protein
VEHEEEDDDDDEVESLRALALEWVRAPGVRR